MLVQVLVVGAGASGILVARHLVARDDQVEVTLVDRDPIAGGTAYRRPDQELLLNVRASAMGADPDAPRGFLDWVRENDPETPEGAFLPRKRYGEYLQALLDALPGSRVRRIQGEVEAVWREDRELVCLRDGRQLSADAVVLALGNPLPAPLPGVPGTDDRVLADPLSPAMLSQIGTDDAVSVIGGGLTAIDVVLALTARGHTGPVTVCSPRGWLPLPHCDHGCPPVESAAFRDLVERDRVGLVDVVVTMRAELRRVETAGRCWRSAVDGLRPYTNRFWVHLDERDRHRYVRRVHPYFERHRHRIAPSLHRVIQGQRDTGRLRVVRGRMVGIERRDGVDGGRRVVVTRDGREVTGDWVVNATGASLRTAAFGPLVTRLVTDGRARPGWNGVGLDVDATGRLRTAAGRPQPTLWTLGPPCRGARWETTAMPEVRVQAAQVAAEIVVR